MLSSVVRTMKSFRDNGVTRRRHRGCGTRGMQYVVDSWKWPKTSQGFLFPSDRSPGKPKSKDSVCHRICKIRKTFRPKERTFNTERVRSHSGRHRMVNDLKRSDATTEVAMTFARIRDKKTFDRYGQLDDHQVGHCLETNRKLKTALKQVYR